MHLPAAIPVLELRQNLHRDEPAKLVVKRHEPRRIWVGERKKRPRLESRDLQCVGRSHRLPILMEHGDENGETFFAGDPFDSHAWYP